VEWGSQWSCVIDFIRTVLLTLLAQFAAIVATCAPSAAQQPKPNIVYIMGDDIGWFNISAYHRRCESADRMIRREFIAGLGSAAVWPAAARAQQGGRMRRVGWIAPPSKGSGTIAQQLNAFKRGLVDFGWIEGRSLAFEERWADGDPERLRPLAADLVAARPDLIFVASSPVLAIIRRATGTIPILFTNVTDPVGQGFVSSLSEPGGNITGFASDEFELSTKQLELLNQIVPSLTRVAFIYDPQQPAAAGVFAKAEAVAPTMGLALSKFEVRNAQEIERAIQAIGPNAGLFLLASSATILNQQLIATMATQYRLPTIHSFRDFAEAGGLASYGVDYIDLSRRAAAYANRILKGEKPADLPVQLPTKFNLVINLKTAKALGLTIPETLLAIADELIQ
jgi:putative tryptophan/tyrosine transport system substrate-binding protein